jgi:asparagine synthase (glutamine-hydrolysing)
VCGAFAFVVWDADAGTVFCARDHFGVKPLYYHLDDDLFAVASAPKALLAIPGVSTDVSDVAVGDFLLHRFEAQTTSCFESIRRLPPAHAMVVGNDDERCRRYWDLDATRTVTLDSDAAYERRFRELFERAVERRLRSKGPVGADLSGGLDSSSIAVTARALLPESEPLYTFSDMYDEAPSSDEREFIETVARRDGISSEYIFLDDVGIVIDADDVQRYLDHPPHDTTHFGKWERAKRVSDTGVRVQLKGELGDETVSHGLAHLPELLKTGRWLRLHRELSALSEVVGTPEHQLLRGNAVAPLVPTRARRFVRRVRGEPILAERANPTLDPAFVREHDLRERYRSLEPVVPLFDQSARYQQRQSLLSGRLTATFETLDQISAAFGVEPRYPFADARLVEFCLAIPPSQQLSDGWTRSIIRRSLSDLLPDKIQWRPWKAMPGEAFNNALRNDDRQILELLREPGPLARYLDVEALEASYERFADTGGGVDSLALRKALALSVWLQEHRAVE